MPLGLDFPNDSVQSQSDVQFPLSTNIFEASINNGVHGMLDGPVDLLKSTYNHFVTPHMTENEWKASPSFREELSFPNGVSQGTAEDSANDFDKKRLDQEILNNTETIERGGEIPHFAGEAVGTILGFVPYTVGGTVLGTIKGVGSIFKVGETVNNAIRDSELISSGVVKSIIGRTAGGALEGTAIASTPALLNYASQEEYGYNPKFTEVLQNIGIGGILGAGFRNVFGFNKLPDPLAERVTPESPISPDAHEQAIRTATDQLENGYTPRVDPILTIGQFKVTEVENKKAQQLSETVNAIKQNDITQQTLAKKLNVSFIKIKSKSGVKESLRKAVKLYKKPELNIDDIVDQSSSEINEALTLHDLVQNDISTPEGVKVFLKNKKLDDYSKAMTYISKSIKKTPENAQLLAITSNTIKRLNNMTKLTKLSSIDINDLPKFSGDEEDAKDIVSNLGFLIRGELTDQVPSQLSAKDIEESKKKTQSVNNLFSHPYINEKEALPESADIEESVPKSVSDNIKETHSLMDEQFEKFKQSAKGFIDCETKNG